MFTEGPLNMFESLFTIFVDLLLLVVTLKLYVSYSATQVRIDMQIVDLCCGRFNAAMSNNLI